MLHNCPLCSAEARVIYKKDQALRFSKQEKRDVYSCLECGTIYPCPRPDLKENRNNFDSSNMEMQLEDPTTWVKKLGFFPSLFKKYRKKYNVRTALDIGCFTGRFCYLLENLGIKAYGLEPQKTAVEYAKDRGLKVFQGFFPETIPEELNNMKYDMISCNESIYYFVDLKKSLNKIYEMLSDDGIIFIKSHQADSYYYSKGQSLFSRYGDYVQSIPTVETLSSALEGAGFSLKDVLSAPEEYFSVIFNLDKNRFSVFQRTFNKIYGNIPYCRNKWLKKADRFIMVAQKRKDK